MEITLAGIRMQAPGAVDREQALRAVARVNEQLKIIEAQSTRIDSHRFALLAAFHFALENERILDDQEAQDRDYVKSLAQIGDALEGLLKKHEVPSG